MASQSVILLLSSAEDEALWRTILASQQMVASALEAPAGSLTDAMRADSRLGRADAILVDLPTLASQHLTLSELAEWTKRRWPDLKLLARVPSRPFLSKPEEAWALANGAAALLPGQSITATRSSIVPSLQKVARAIGNAEIDASCVDNFLRAMVSGEDNPIAAAIGRTHGLLDWLAHEEIKLHDLSRKMQASGGVSVEDRSYRGRTYRQCFLGTEAVAWMRAQGHLNDKSHYAVAEAMARTGLVHHVVRKHLFTDSENFFRFDGLPAALDPIDLHGLSRDMRGAKGIRIGTRTHLGKTYENCFVGAEAVDWLVARHGLTVGGAETMGQRLIDLGVIHHVVDEHGFIDGNFFYRFVTDDLQR